MVTIITGVVTLVSVILANSRSRTVMEVKLDAHTEKVERHNQVLERTYRLEKNMAIAKNDITDLKGKVARHEQVPGRKRLEVAPARTIAWGVLDVVVANLDPIMG